MPFKVDQCCCGCTLRTGTILIAVYYIVGSSFTITLTSMGLFWAKHEMHRNAEILNTTEPVIRGGQERNATYSSMTEYMAGVTAMYSVIMIYCALSIMLNVMLLIGAKAEKVRLMHIWIIAHVIYLVAAVVGQLTNMFMSILNPGQKAGSVGLSLINIVLTFYFLVVVSSYYQQVKDRQSSIPSQRPSSQAPPIVVYIDEHAPPPPYSELYPPWPQQNAAK